MKKPLSLFLSCMLCFPSFATSAWLKLIPNCPNITVVLRIELEELHVNNRESGNEVFNGKICTKDGSWCSSLNLKPGSRIKFSLTKSHEVAKGFILTANGRTERKCNVLPSRI